MGLPAATNLLRTNSLTVEVLPMEKVRGVFETNTLGTIAMAQAVLPQMRARMAGTIINLSSSTTLEIYNVLGVPMVIGINQPLNQPQTSNLNPETVIDISSLAKGVYFIQLCRDNKVYRTKLMKQ